MKYLSILTMGIAFLIAGCAEKMSEADKLRREIKEVRDNNEIPRLQAELEQLKRENSKKVYTRKFNHRITSIKEYRDWLERNGRNKISDSDACLAIELGEEAERRGLSIESRFGSDFKDFYLDIKNRPERPLLNDFSLAFKKQWHKQRASALENSANMYGGRYEDALRESAEKHRQKAAATPTPSIESKSDVRRDRLDEIFRWSVISFGSSAPSLIRMGLIIVAVAVFIRVLLRKITKNKSGRDGQDG